MAIVTFALLIVAAGCDSKPQTVVPDPGKTRDPLGENAQPNKRVKAQPPTGKTAE